MSTWNANAYLRFDEERTRPAAELAARVHGVTPRTVIDLGCGPGNSTQVLRSRWPEARVLGLDSSSEMIAAAKAKHPDQEWVLADLRAWSAQVPVDVVFSSSALQWIPEHDRLARHLFAQVAQGGALAFQIPSRAYSLIRSLMHDVAGDGRWCARMQGALAALTMEEPSYYYDALAGEARSLDIWETEYQHVVAAPEDVVDWIASTGLRPFLDALGSDAERKQFAAMLTERVGDAYPRRHDSKVLFPFRRLFVVAYRR